jgi:hypothetical protein
MSNEKVLEYVIAIEGVHELDDVTVEELKEAMVASFTLGDDISTLEKFSVKTILKTYDYSLRYIYTNTEGNELCKIEISKSDLPE